MLRNAHAKPGDAARRGARTGGARISGWCHFTCPADGAPDSLRELTRQAGLYKKRLAFSFLLAAKDTGITATPAGNAACRTGTAENAGKADLRAKLRVLSDPIVVPGESAPARYACMENGLALLSDVRNIPSGALVRASVRKDSSGKDMRDAKSGLPVYTLAEEPSRKGGFRP
jgi:hypothetical protein